MKYIYTIIFTTFLALNAQTAGQIKKQLNGAGITPDQAKQMARDQGYSDTQIEAEVRAQGLDVNGKSAETKIKPVGNLQSELSADELTVILAEESNDLTL